MNTIDATCPLCHTTNRYGEELIGRYTLCQNCQCRFYVEVPTLEESARNGAVVRSQVSTPSPRETTLDDLLWDTQQGSRFIIQSMARQEQQLRQIFYGIVLMAALLAINLIIALR